MICWTPDGCRDINTRTNKSGGTGTAIAMAYKMGIPIYNIYWDKDFSKMIKYLEKQSD